jgi:hypothetical protein
MRSSRYDPHQLRTPRRQSVRGRHIDGNGSRIGVLAHIAHQCALCFGLYRGSGVLNRMLRRLPRCC